jgi:hypothetical protein
MFTITTPSGQSVNVHNRDTIAGGFAAATASLMGPGAVIRNGAIYNTLPSGEGYELPRSCCGKGCGEKSEPEPEPEPKFVNLSGTSTCSGRSCSKKEKKGPPAWYDPNNYMVIPPTIFGKVPQGLPSFSTAKKVKKAKKAVRELGDIHVLIYAPHADAVVITDILRNGYYNVFERDTPLKENFNIMIQHIDNDVDLNRELRTDKAYDLIIVHGGNCNDVLRAASATDYDGSLLLIAGATAGVLDADVKVPPKCSVILTHGFGAGEAIVSRADYVQIVGAASSWLYTNIADSVRNTSSLIGPYARGAMINREFEHPYLLEMVRALKLGDMTKLEDKLSQDSYIELNPWA